MDLARIEMVSRSRESVEHYHRLYSILKSVLPEYVGELESLERSSFRKGLDHFAVLLEDSVVGGYVFEPLSQSECHLDFIGLTEGIQNTGLGNLMTAHMKERARELGRNRIIAEIHRENFQKFNRMGFKKFVSNYQDRLAIYLEVN